MKQRTEEVLDRVDEYRRLLRFKYTDLEKLSRLNILADYYSSQDKEPSTETFTVNIECAEELAIGDFKIPLKVRGVFLTEGRPKAKYYSREELEKAADNPINNNFPLMLDHKDNEAGKVIGLVDKIKYNPAIKGLQWWGHINDETFARNVMDGAIKEVSATIYSTSEYSEQLGLIGTDLAFKELSLVIKGAEKNNSIYVDDGSDDY